MPAPSYEILRAFLDTKMRMSHIYQPVMLETLLVKGSPASAREIAAAILAHDESQLDYYEQIVKNMPGRVLRAHGIVEKKARDYSLVPADLSAIVRSLMRLDRQSPSHACRWWSVEGRWC